MKPILVYLAKMAAWSLWIMAAGLILLVFREEGVKGVGNTFRNEVWTVTRQYIPIIIIFFTITGFVNHLNARHPERFNNILLGKEGKVKMVALAALLPGPSGGTQLKNAWLSRVVTPRNMMLCLIGMMGLNFNAIIFRAPVLGPQLTAIWIGTATSLLFVVWLGASLWTRLFG